MFVVFTDDITCYVKTYSATKLLSNSMVKGMEFLRKEGMEKNYEI